MQLLQDYALPFVYALVVWWFSTGAVLFLDHLPRWTFRRTMWGATALLVIGLAGLAASAGDASVGGAYLAFTCGLLVWAWQEISFYTGAVTGPRRHRCKPGCRGWRHFGHALQVSLYHEIAIAVTAVVVFALTWGKANMVGAWTYLILWLMHESARLNVFLGVRNLYEEFVPSHLDFLQSFLTRRAMNPLFPFSVLASTIAAVLLGQQALAPQATPFEAAGYTLLCSLLVLAILEHWLLILPLPAQKLWQWSLRPAATTPSSLDVEVLGRCPREQSG